MGQNYQTAKKVALKTIIVLGVVTVIEVLIALSGKGHLIEGFHLPWWLMNFAMISLSLYKAYLIVGEFMHLRHEVRALGMTVLLPVVLLIWAIIAFMYEGGAWKGNREKIMESDVHYVEQPAEQQGMLYELNTRHTGHE